MPVSPERVGDASRRPLLVTSDLELLDAVLRLAALAGADLDVCPDAGSARVRWTTAPIVVVGADVVVDCIRLRLPRRPDVVLIGGDLDDAGVWQQAVAVGAEHVLFLPEAEPWVVEVFADAAEGAAPEGPLVAVVGGRGGAGATTLACALAVTATRAGRTTLLVDGDPLGGGIDLVFGGEGTRGLRWQDLGATRGRIPAAALASALPRMADLSVLSWGRGETHALAPEAVRAVLGAGRRASDLVVVDLPRVLDEAARLVLGQATTTLLVVPAEVRAAAAAGRVAATVSLFARDVQLVVRGPSPTGLTGDAMARALALPLAGEMRLEPHLSCALDRGEAPPRRPRGPLGSFCTAFLDELLPADRSAA